MKIMKLTKNDVSIELENWEGDYDPEDDESLLRVIVLYKGKQVENASYCTAIPETAAKAFKLRFLKTIMNDIYDEVISDISIKKKMEWYSWAGMYEDITK